MQNERVPPGTKEVSEIRWHGSAIPSFVPGGTTEKVGVFPVETGGNFLPSLTGLRRTEFMASHSIGRRNQSDSQ